MSSQDGVFELTEC